MKKPRTTKTTKPTTIRTISLTNMQHVVGGRDDDSGRNPFTTSTDSKDTSLR
jgi:hypothetical protein